MSAAWIFAIFALAAGVVAHLAAVDRVPSRDSGGFWAQVLDRLAMWVGIPLLAISCVHGVGAIGQWIPSGSFVWLAAVGGAWAIILILGILRVPAPEDGRWIAGTLDFSPHRFWMLYFALPFLPVVWFVRPPWPEDVDAGHWAITLLFLITLAGIALSAAPIHVWIGPRRRDENEAPVALSPWPDEMRSRGVAVRSITDWQPSIAPEPATGIDAEWQRRLTAAGATAISPTLCSAVSQLMGWSAKKNEHVAIVLGPDHCGQEEVTALMATELARRQGQATLVITSGAGDRLAARLNRWLERLGGESPARLIDLAEAPASVRGDLLVADAETLSDSILDELRGEIQRYGDPTGEGRGLGNIGLVVWWNAHEFSGVLAAHVWAVSRRLERLLRSRRGWNSRALVFARRPREREAPFVAFLEHLLPYPLKDNQFQIGSDFARRTWLYRLEDTAPTASSRAVAASLLTDWPTLAPSEATLPAPMPRPEAESAAAAGAQIVEIKPAELLSLQEMICQGGRSSPPGVDHHVAAAASENPYAEFLLARYAGPQRDTAASVHLVSAEGHPELVRRHLLLALREVPDTLTGLRETFHWEEKTLRATLHRLSHEDRLSRRPVRFLDADGRLQRDSQYANQNPGQGAIRSFRIIGRARPVELRDRKVKDRLLLQVDPERLPIEAYPMRVFESPIESGGRRYRVQGWTGQPDRIDCIPEESGIRTWRFSISRVSSFEPYGESLSFRGMERYAARVQYREDVNRVLERDGNGSFRNIGFDVVRTGFETEALILEFSSGFDPLDLVSAALALRHVLPIHTAVDEDALQVVPFDKGLALVDLYPGGIGLVNAIHKTVWLVPMLFDRAAEWLSQSSKEDLSMSPFVRTMGMGGLDLKRAVRVFSSAAMQAR